MDCGGSCPNCETCSDGIQNGAETGVDCGGGVCPVCVQQLPSRQALDNFIAEFGAHLGVEQTTATFHRTEVVAWGPIAIGFWTKQDPHPQPLVPLNGSIARVVFAGHGVERLKCINFAPESANDVLGVPLLPPAANLQPVVGVSLTRWDAAGGLISNAMVTFEVQLPLPHPQMQLYRYAAGAPEGALLTSEGGLVGECERPDPQCLRVTSPRTSTFLAYERVPPPKGFCDPEVNKYLPGCVDGCRKYFTLQVLPVVSRDVSSPSFR